MYIGLHVTRTGGRHPGDGCCAARQPVCLPMPVPSQQLHNTCSPALGAVRWQVASSAWHSSASCRHCAQQEALHCLVCVSGGVVHIFLLMWWQSLFSSMVDRCHRQQHKHSASTACAACVAVSLAVFAGLTVHSAGLFCGYLHPAIAVRVVWDAWRCVGWWRPRGRCSAALFMLVAGPDTAAGASGNSSWDPQQEHHTQVGAAQGCGFFMLATSCCNWQPAVQSADFVACL
jgi:hypothetical protein